MSGKNRFAVKFNLGEITTPVTEVQIEIVPECLIS